MINSIEIEISNYPNVFIDINKKVLMINNNIKNITKEQIGYLFRIIRNWDNNYNSNLISENYFFIKITLNNEVSIIKGNGRYPDNYDELINFIGELNE